MVAELWCGLLSSVVGGTVVKIAEFEMEGTEGKNHAQTAQTGTNRADRTHPFVASTGL